MSKNYTILHLHTTLSNAHINIDSITHYHEYVDMAKNNNMKAISFTEHGNILEWVKKKEYAESQGLKYIHGVEAYITETLEEKIRDNYHCILLAKNEDGVKEINRLVSISNDENHKYYVPRISIDELEKTSSNIIILTACLGGILNKAEPALQRRFLSFLMRNKRRCYLEIQHHNTTDQINYNRKLYKLSRECGLKLVACTDTHALNQKQMDGRKVLQKAKDIKFAEEEDWDLTFKTYDELVEAFTKQRSLPIPVIMEAIENTNVIADSVEEFTLDRSYKYPHLWEDPEKTFKEAIAKGIKKRKIYTYPNYEVYQKRICDEFQTYKANGAIDFMLLMYDIIQWCKEQNIQTGYGRGSVNGSLIAYLLGITEMDSVKFNLNFSRFMNSERVSLADIDTDFPPSRIDEVKKYVFEHYGMYCCDIVTFNTIADKGAIRDVCRGLYKDREDIDYLKLADEICDNLETNAEKMREKYPDVFKYVDLVKGTVVSIGNHPCGMVCSPLNIEEWFGTITTSSDPFPISQINMKEIDSLNFVKLDLLKLDTIEVIKKTCDYIGIPMVTPDNVDAMDEKVWDSIRDNTVSIFQWEGAMGDKYIKKLLSDSTIEKFQKLNKDVDRMTLFSIGNSAIRPAGASYREDLANGVIRSIGAKPIDEFLSSTFGYLVFQEQIIQFLHEYCGFTMGQADQVRRCVDEDSLISMSNGELKKIKDVQIGDYVQSFDENGAVHSRRVNAVYDNGYAKTYKIKTNNSYELIATSDHKVLTQDGWKAIGQLQIGDSLFTPSKINYDHDGLRGNQRLQSTDMFLLGLLLGDGSMGTLYDIHFTNSDEEIVKKYMECVGKRLKNNKPECEFRVCSTDGVTVNKVYSVYIATKRYKDSLKNLIKKLDLAKKSKGKRIPPSLLHYPADEKLANLLGALFSTDAGVVNKRDVIEYYTTSEKLAYDVKQLLLKFNVYSYVYKSWVSGYDYYCYKTSITQIDSLKTFGEKILPYVVGHKKDEYIYSITHKSNTLSYNYLLPCKYVEEIKESIKNYRISFRSIGSEIKSNTITDVKARKMVANVYAPQTYKLLMSHYQPVAIKAIEEVGTHHVYDIEVDEFHNYVANGIIVHNCFAKKYGTDQFIPIIKNGGEMNGKHIDGYIKTMKERYGISEKRSEKDITAFLKVIEDASNYLFSLNHSQPYSYMGYAEGWLRYYYPLEFLTAALNINQDNEAKTTELTKYANLINVKIEQPKFRKTKDEYFYDKSTNMIYKGLKSVKFMNSTVAKELFELRDNHYENFVSLYEDLVGKTSLNRRQIEILIRMNFFDEFGSNKSLLKIYDLCEKIYWKKQFSKSSLDKFGVSEFLVRKYSNKETEKLFRDIDAPSIVRELVSEIKDERLPIDEQIENELEYLGYVNYTNEKIEDDYYIVLKLYNSQNKRKPFAHIRRIKDGQEKMVKIKMGEPINENNSMSIIRVERFALMPKYRYEGKDENGKNVYQKTDELVEVIEDYRLIK